MKLAIGRAKLLRRPDRRPPGPGRYRETPPSCRPARPAGRRSRSRTCSQVSACSPPPPRCGDKAGPDSPETADRWRRTRSSNSPTAPAGWLRRCRGVARAWVILDRRGRGLDHELDTSILAITPGGAIPAGKPGRKQAGPGPPSPIGKHRARRKSDAEASGGPGQDFMVESGPRFGLAYKSCRRLAEGLRADPTNGGDWPGFAQSSEQNVTVPLSEAVLGQALSRLDRRGAFCDTSRPLCRNPRPAASPVAARRHRFFASSTLGPAEVAKACVVPIARPDAAPGAAVGRHPASGRDHRVGLGGCGQSDARRRGPAGLDRAVGADEAVARRRWRVAGCRTSGSAGPGQVEPGGAAGRPALVATLEQTGPCSALDFWSQDSTTR